MTDERMTAAAIVAERPDMQPTGEFYLELAMTGAVVAAVTPHGRREVAGFLRAILQRAPVALGEAYEPHRAVLGALVSELETAAIAGALDDPATAVPDVRDPGVTAKERQLIQSTRDWADGERSRRGEAERARIYAIVAEGAPAHAAAQARLDTAVAEAEAFVAGAHEIDDAASLFS